MGRAGSRVVTKVLADVVVLGSMMLGTGADAARGDRGKYVIAANTARRPSLGVLARELASLTGTKATRLMSITRTGDSAARGDYGDISAGGRYVAFASSGANVVASDTNGASDVFVRDMDLGLATRVSVTSAGAQATGVSAYPSISGNGRRVAFHSLASNLIGAGDTNTAADIFLRDTPADGSAGTTTLVSATASGAQTNGDSEMPSLSYDGNRIAFQSIASNLVPGDTNSSPDIFVKDLTTGAVVRASVDSAGRQANAGSTHPSISADGRYVVFRSTASNLVPGDTNAQADVFLYDIELRQTETASLSNTEQQSSHDSYLALQNSVSAHGRFVVFSSRGALVTGDDNYAVDVFVRDRLNAATSRASVSLNGGSLAQDSTPGAISPDGRYVGFQTADPSVVTGDTRGTDSFAYDRWTGKNERISVRSDGTEVGGSSSSPTSFSKYGSKVAFHSTAGIDPVDTNGSIDTYVRETSDQSEGPPSFVVTEATATSLTLEWADVYAGEISYILERSTDDFATIESTSILGADTTTFTDEGLRAATIYRYRLSAQRSVGNSPYGTVHGLTENLYVPDLPEIETGIEHDCDQIVATTAFEPFRRCALEEMHEHRATLVVVNVCLSEQQQTRGLLEDCVTMTLFAPKDPPPIPDEDDPSVPPPPRPGERGTEWVPPTAPGEPKWEWGSSFDDFPTRRGSWHRPCPPGNVQLNEYLHWDSPHPLGKDDHWGYTDCDGKTYERFFDIVKYPNAWSENPLDGGGRG